MESYRTGLIPTAVSVDSICKELSTSTARLSLEVQGFYHVGTLCLACSKIPEGKQVLSRNYTVCTSS